MPKAKLYRFDALDAGPEEVEVPEALFGGPIHQDLLYRAVRVYLANQRQGTAKAKTRGEVAGGGRKPWRQKGTGRARHGSIRSPIWRHGGVTFGPVPGEVRLALPKRMRRKALVSALSARCQDGCLVLVDRLGFERPRTKDGLKFLSQVECPKTTLVVVAPEEWRVEVTKTFSNIPGVECVRSDFLSAYHVLAYEGLLMTERAVQTLAGRLGHG